MIVKGRLDKMIDYTVDLLIFGISKIVMGVSDGFNIYDYF